MGKRVTITFMGEKVTVDTSPKALRKVPEQAKARHARVEAERVKRFGKFLVEAMNGTGLKHYTRGPGLSEAVLAAAARIEELEAGPSMHTHGVPLRKSEFARGAEAAAGVAADWNTQSNAKLRLEDIILFKLNLRDGKPRKNPHAQKAFLQGFALALAEMNRDGQDVARVMKSAGTTIAEMREAGVDDYDLNELIFATTGKRPKEKK